MKGPARSTAPEYTADYKQWLTQIDRILARHQLTNGTGTIVLYQIEKDAPARSKPFPLLRRSRSAARERIRKHGHPRKLK
jgi:hypothetical protein